MFRMPDIQWTTQSLQSVESKFLREVNITINTLDNFISPPGETLHRELLDLNRLLVELWTLPYVSYAGTWVEGVYVEVWIASEGFGIFQTDRLTDVLKRRLQESFPRLIPPFSRFCFLLFSLFYIR